MRSIYDAVLFATCLFSSAMVAALTGSTAVTSAAIDSKGYNTAVLRGHADTTSSNPSVATVAYTLTECATSGGSYVAANDNTGTQIGFTLDVHAAAADGVARIEGLNGLNRKRYFKVVMTPAFTGGTSPAINAVAEIAFGRAYQLPTNTGASNT